MVSISRRFSAPASSPRTDKDVTVRGEVVLAAGLPILGEKNLLILRWIEPRTIQYVT